ncbi:MAG: ABC transporter permease [Lachnospiraceae bacterium]|nr:ABC transporter permease [Lachnospiraceae bacterium]
MEKKNRKKNAYVTLARVYAIILFVFIYAPVVLMIAFSFNDSRANVVWSGFTLKYYAKLFHDSGIWKVFGITVFVAVISTILGVFVGTTGAVGLTNAKFKGKKLITNSIYFPIVIPEIVLAVSLLLTFKIPGIAMSLVTVIIGNTTLILPYIYITVKARLVGMDPSVEEASLDLGADRVYTFLHITLPAIMPGVVSGAFMGFSLVLDDLIVTSFLANAETTTLPMKVYSMIKKGISPEINALTTIIFAVCAVGLLVYLLKWALDVYKEKKAKANALL